MSSSVPPGSARGGHNGHQSEANIFSWDSQKYQVLSHLCGESGALRI